MLSERELVLRQRSLGASEIGVIAGHSLYREATAFKVWESKIYGAEQLSSPAMMAGSAMEPGIATLYRQQIGEDGIRLWKARRRVHRDRRWMSATPDYYVVADGSIRRLLECKWVGPGQDTHWDWHDPIGVPDMYRDQGDWQMDVTGIDQVDIAAFFASTRQLHVWRFDVAVDRANALVELGERFWFDHVIAEVPPPLDFSEAAKRYLAAIHPTGAGMVDASVETVGWARQYSEASADEKDAKQRKEHARNELCAAIGDNEGIRAPWGKATWKAGSGGKPNWKAIAGEYRELLSTTASEALLDSIQTRLTPDAARTLRCKFKEP